ncbi:MAG: MBL fold metallo-hydrolase [Clostridia bacterium]|jgi:phosphoribosyl 1,2-cyclic phosphodiesterase|nr:MBL fold metallo-hydrolase [Clostridia bacterium]
MSGSSGNAIYIETAKAKFLIDAGAPGKRIAQALQSLDIDARELDAVVITHAHRDHVCGAGVISRRYNLPLYATAGTWQEMSGLIGEVKPGLTFFIEKEQCLQLKDAVIEPFSVSHDALDPVGFVISSESRRVGIATDCGVFTAKMGAKLANLDCLILEANHDIEMLHKGPYPWPLKKRIAGATGHLSNAGAGQALSKIIGERTRNVILAHLSEQNNLPELALETVQSVLEESRVNLQEVKLSVAPRHRPGYCLNIG